MDDIAVTKYMETVISKFLENQDDDDNNFKTGAQEWFKGLKTDNMDVGANLAYSNDITVTKFLNNPANDTSVTKFMDSANDTSVTKFLN